MAHLLVEDLTKKFGGVSALRNLNLEIQDGEFFVLLGPTGAGKTTTLRLICGLENPDAGRIYLDHSNVNAWGPAERDVAIVFQQYSLYPKYTVRQNIEFPLKAKIRNLTGEEIGRRVTKAARTLRIEHLLDRKTDKLSGGEMQRVSIGRAIVRNPRIFLMDEPLASLDAKLREVLRSELKDLQISLGATFLYVTHDQFEAMTMGERIGVLRAGELLQVGTPDEVYNIPANTYVAQFVGTPTMNLLRGFIQENRLVISREGFEFELRHDVLQHIGRLQGELEVGLRPEDIMLGNGEGFKARVYGTENLGMLKIVSLKIGDHLLKATVDTDMRLDLDAVIQFKIRQEKLYFFSATTGENLLKDAR